MIKADEGDVHLGNLLVDDQGYFRIVDFGLARCSDEQQDSRGRGGVAAFFEPEYARAVFRLQQVAELAEPAGRGCRWPWLIHTRNGREASAYMPGWCNGTAGYVHVWVFAHPVFGDERYLRLAEQAG